jgi:hypothetical protein
MSSHLQATRLLSTGGSTGSAPATDSSGATPPHVQHASPGATCLAILLQRCSDKSAVVRAKAMSNLAGVVIDQLRSGGHSFRQVCRSQYADTMRCLRNSTVKPALGHVQ